MKIIHYLSRIFVCLPKLCFQTKAKTKPDLHMVGSNRTRDQLWPPSSLLAVHSPGDQLHVVALQSADFPGIGRNASRRNKNSAPEPSHIFEKV